jgi:glyoxylase-like metal-dependent hydrolase (beta-lactamase superfamily II)
MVLRPLIAIAASLAILAMPLAGCTTTYARAGRTGTADIIQIELPLSNAYLIRSKSPILVDVGSEGDAAALVRATTASGTRPSDIGLVVLTHGHADHAGDAAELMKLTHAPVALGEGDLALAVTGHNDDLVPMNFLACFLQLALPQSYPPFVPDLVVRDEPLDLAPWGVAGRVIPMPGHTRGSLVVLLDDHSAFVGDQILGGYFGGAIAPTSPGLHYFHADREANDANVAKLLELGVEKFYLGHGGPVSRADVLREMDLPGTRGGS